jgi:hypothetical protein
MEKITSNSVEVERILMGALDMNINVLIPGPPGCGKSSIIEDVSTKWNGGVPLHMFHLVTSDPIDCKGMPTEIDDVLTGNKMWDFRPFGDLMRIIDCDDPIIPGHCTGPCIAFLDDFGTAQKSVQAAWMQIILAYRLGMVRIHPEVRFVMATNRTGDKSGAEAGVLETIKGRSLVLPMDANVQTWCRWAISNNMENGKPHPGEVIAFARWVDSKSEPLFEFKPTKDAELNSCTPRNLSRMSMFVDLWGGDCPLAVINGCVGPHIGTKFLAFLKTFKKLPKLEQVIADPTGTSVPSDINLQYPMVTYLSSKSNNKNFEEVSTYILRFPPEFRVMFTKDVVANWPNVCNHTAYGKLIADVADDVYDAG